MPASLRPLLIAMLTVAVAGLVAAPAGSQDLYKGCGSFKVGEKTYRVQGYEIEQASGTNTGKVKKLDKATCTSAGKALKQTLKKSGTYNGWSCTKPARQGRNAVVALCDYTPAASQFWKTRALRTK